MLVNLFLGVFLVTCRSECGPFKTPEGGKLLSIFCWLLADRSVRFLTPKRRGNAVIFSWVSVGSLSVPKSTFPTPNSIEFGAGSVDFGFAFAECRGLAVVLRTWRDGKSDTTHHNHHQLHHQLHQQHSRALVSFAGAPRAHREERQTSKICQRPAKSSKSSKIQVKIQLNPSKSQQIQLNGLPE